MKTYKKIEGDKYQIIETTEKVRNINLSALEDEKKRLQTKIDKIDEDIKELKKAK